MKGAASDRRGDVTLSDAELGESVVRLLSKWGFVRSDRPIRVTVTRGVVTIEGSVPYERDIHTAGSMVEGIPGVVAVVNRLLYRFDDLDRSGISSVKVIPSQAEGAEGPVTGPNEPFRPGSNGTFPEASGAVA